MFNLGFGEILVICVVLIIVVGPERLPSLMKTVGKAVRTMRQASRDLQTSVGLDEIMREDIMQPLPRPLAPPPAATISRDQPPPLQAGGAETVAVSAEPASDAAPAPAPSATADAEVAPTVQPVETPAAPKAQG